MANAHDVANYFLATNPPDSITNLKLQKLCSYAQAISIAYLKKQIFPENIEMWELGPVVREIYDLYKKFDDKPIPKAILNLDPFLMDSRLILAAVNSYYSEPFNAWGLCVQSHRDFPGLRGSNQVLSFEDMSNAFAKNPLVVQLRRADEKRGEIENTRTLSVKEFFDALDS